MRSRSEVLELAVLGQLADAPLHGYELRKRLNATLGAVRALSYGSLYPALRSLERSGFVEAVDTADLPHALAGRRTRVVYQLTADGKERLATKLNSVDPASWDDDRFGVHFSLFHDVEPEVRLRVLEGRRTRMLERREAMRTQLARNRARRDAWTLELQRHGLEQIDREVHWLEDLITSERQGRSPRSATPDGGSPGPPSRSASVPLGRPEATDDDGDATS